MHATLEHMTIWSLISDATPLVKGVMLTLLLASLTSWYLIVQRSLLLGRSERLLKQFQQQFRASADLAQLYREGDATADDLVRLAAGQFAAVEHELATVGRVGAGEHVEERGLAGAVGADQAVDLTLVDGERDLGQRVQAAEAFADVAGFEQGDHCAPSRFMFSAWA